jgi:hypothetical protein
MPRKGGRNGKGYDQGDKDQLPLELVRKIVRRYSTRGDLVLSIAGELGRGTDVIAAMEEGRSIISLLSSKSTFVVSQSRVQEFAAYQKRVYCKTSDLLSAATRRGTLLKARALCDDLQRRRDTLSDVDMKQLDLSTAFIESGGIVFEQDEDEADAEEGWVNPGASPEETGHQEDVGRVDADTGMVCPTSLTDEDLADAFEKFASFNGRWSSRCVTAGHSPAVLADLQKSYLKKTEFADSMKSVVSMLKDDERYATAQSLLAEMSTTFTKEHASFLKPPSSPKPAPMPTPSSPPVLHLQAPLPPLSTPLLATPAVLDTLPSLNPAAAAFAAQPAVPAISPSSPGHVVEAPETDEGSSVTEGWVFGRKYTHSFSCDIF